MNKGAMQSDEPEREHSTGWVYILQCADGTLYTGWTTDPARRLKEHNEGTGAKYTKSRRPVRMIYRRDCGSKADAMKEEWRIKHLTREQKLSLAGL